MTTSQPDPGQPHGSAAPGDGSGQAQPAWNPPAYGSMPPPTEAYGAKAPLPSMPKQVDWASKILFVAAGWQIVGTILAFANRAAAEDSIRDADTTLTESEISTAATVGLTFGAVISLVFAGLYLLSGLKMRQGKNWARIVGTVMVALAVVFGLLGSAVSGGLALVVQLITVVLGIAFLVLAWSKPSNEYMQAAGRTAR